MKYNIDSKKGVQVTPTEKEVEKCLLVCYCCNKVIMLGQSYEKITTHNKKKIVVHTDCIKKGCE